MNRAGALNWCINRYGDLYTKAGIPLTDSPDGFAPVLDDAWAMLGVDVASPIAASDLDRAYVALRYTTLRRVRTTLGLKYDKVIKGISLLQWEMWKAVDKEYEDAKAALARFGLDGMGPNGQYGGAVSYADIDFRPQRSMARSGGYDEFGG
jgi:hypothetical protein